MNYREVLKERYSVNPNNQGTKHQVLKPLPQTTKTNYSKLVTPVVIPRHSTKDQTLFREMTRARQHPKIVINLSVSRFP